jgi:hypothetical protein
MTVDDRENARTDDTPRPRQSEQATLPQTGDSGTVETHGGTTSLGTTPIGLGSVGPVQQHQRAAEMIMGETDDWDMQARAASRPVGGETQGGPSGILKKITEPRIAVIVLGLAVVAIAVAAFGSRRRQ